MISVLLVQVNSLSIAGGLEVLSRFEPVSGQSGFVETVAVFLHEGRTDSGMGETAGGFTGNGKVAVYEVLEHGFHGD